MSSEGGFTFGKSPKKKWRANADADATPPLKCSIIGENCQVRLHAYTQPWREPVQPRCTGCGADVCLSVLCSRVLDGERGRQRQCLRCVEAADPAKG